MKQFLAFMLSLCMLTGCAGQGMESETDEKNALPIERDGVVIALLDTGVSDDAIQSENLLPGWNYVTDTDDTNDRINHGTAVASVILGSESAGIEALAPDIHVVPLVITDKVDGTVKSVTPDVLAQAIRDSVDKYSACIINVSLGIRKDDPMLREAVAYVQEMGALIIAAVGNGGENTGFYYPAAYDGVLSVGSHDKNFEVSDFTQQNGTADILAPGEDIWLASRNGKTYGARGTSYSTAYVSAAAAWIWKNDPKLGAEEVRMALLASASDVNGWKILTFPS